MINLYRQNKYLRYFQLALIIAFLDISFISVAFTQPLEIKLNDFNEKFKRKNYTSAIIVGKEIIQYANEIDSVSLIAKAYKLIGNAYSQMDSLNEAEFNYKLGLNQFTLNNIENEIEKSKILYNLALIYEKRKQISDAVQFLNKSYICLLNLKFPEFQISDWVTSRLYKYKVGTGDKNISKSILVNRMSLFEKFKKEETYDYADICQSLGTIYLLDDDYFSAEKYYNLSSDILSKINRLDINYAYNQFYLGGIYLQAGDRIKAENRYKTTLFIIDSLLRLDTTLYENSLVQNLFLGTRDALANVFFQLHQYENALEIYIELKDYYKDDDFDKYFDAVLSITYCFINLNEREKALNLLQDTYLEFKNDDRLSSPMRISILSSISSLSSYLKRDTFLKAALTDYEHIVVYMYGRSSKEYINYLILKCDLVSNTYKKSVSSFINIKQLKNNILALEKAFQSVKSKLSLSDTIEIYTNLARYYSYVNDYSKALSILYHIDSLIETSRMPINFITREKYLVEQSNILLKIKRYGDVFLIIKKYIAYLKNDLSNNTRFLTNDELSDFWPTERNRLKWALNMLFSIHKYVPESSSFIYELVLLTKGYILNADMERRSFLNSAGDSTRSSQLYLVDSLKQQISKYFSSNNLSTTHNDSVYIYELNSKVDSIMNALMRSPKNSKLFSHSLDVKWVEVKNKLAKDETTVEYFQFYDFVENKSWYAAILINSNSESPLILRICNYDSISNNLFRFSDSDLYKLIWAPIEKRLTGIKRVYISPSSYLNQISFAALSFEDNDSFKYLIDKYDLIQLQSTYSLINMSSTNRNIRNKSAALFGGIDFNNFENSNYVGKNNMLESKNIPTERGLYFSYLPETKSEIDSISSILKANGWRLSVYSGNNASEANFKKDLPNKFNIIHIATHGFAYDSIDRRELPDSAVYKPVYTFSENPLVRCGLLFSGANISWSGINYTFKNSSFDDGILTGYELEQTNLSDVDMIVLSACNTANGQITSYEGVFGLKRAISSSGAKSAVLTLWQIDDKFTQEFMIHFYSELVKSDDISTTFAKCQRYFRLKYPLDSRKWGAFIYLLN